MDFLANALNHRQCRHLQFWLSNCYFLWPKSCWGIVFLLYIHANCFILGDKWLNNGLRLDFDNSLDFQAIIYSVPLSSFNSNVLNVGWQINIFLKASSPKKKVLSRK